MTRTVLAGERSFAVVPDATRTFDALIVGRAVDELTGRPPLGPARVAARLRGVSPEAPEEGRRFAASGGRGGTFALSGRPAEAFPDLDLNPHTVDLVVTAPGYLDTPVAVPVPQGAAFPLPAVSVPLRRDAVTLKGRVTTGVPAAPVAGAQVELVAPPGLVGFQAPLAFRHPAATGVTPTPLAPTGANLELSDDVHPGARRAPLERRAGLAVDSIVRFGSGARAEFAILAAIEGPADLSRPGAVLLRAGLRFAHRRDDGPARRVAPGAPGAPAQLSGDAFAGDRVAAVDYAGLLPDGGPVLLDDPEPSRREYLTVRRAAAQTDANGDYRIAPVGRAAALTVRVVPPLGPAPPDVNHIVSYENRENVLNLRV